MNIFLKTEEERVLETKESMYGPPNELYTVLEISGLQVVLDL